MKNLPKAEMPRERLSRYGHDALSSIELLAILLGSGHKERNVLELASDLLMQFGSLERLADASSEELSELKGIGSAKALQLKAAFALGCRLKQKEEKRLAFDQVDQLAGFIRQELNANKSESVMVLLCDVHRQVFHREVIAVGTLTEVLLHPREVFYPAIRHKAHSLILAHNHPSGDPTPSMRDVQMTDMIANAGRTLGILLLDHLIVGTKTHFSFRDKNLLKNPL